MDHGGVGSLKGDGDATFPVCNENRRSNGPEGSRSDRKLGDPGDGDLVAVSKSLENYWLKIEVILDCKVGVLGYLGRVGGGCCGSGGLGGPALES